ncbi:hypothetical protein DEX24_01525 [Kurthia sibirica]|uniref:UPF0154 protein DEX24_01525 n=1 Tax=Kurthia sibirica TaxID=202750 RepID=A0A2U3AR32_9BACL|nr:hypothetical protein DEX24_01525 [Kurthia sibirica]
MFFYCIILFGEYFLVSENRGGTQVSTGLAVTLIIVGVIVGLVGGFFIARQYMMKYLKDNPPVNEDMLRMMMTQMGRKPSEKQVRQVMSQMNKASDKPEKKKK